MPDSALVDGRPARQGALARLRRRGQRLMISHAEHDEVALERQLLELPGVTRANTVAVMSPTGGVGKTTCTFLIANLLVTHLKLRVIAVDANPEFGTLGRLVSDDRRPESDLTELLERADSVHTAAELRPYVARLATGLHVLARRHEPEQAACLGPARYGELLALLACFYEVVLLDLGTGMVGPVATLAAQRCDHIVLVMTPGYVTSRAALDALAHVQRHERTTVAINMAHGPAAAEERVLSELAHDVVTVPRDDRLGAMLDSGTYTLGALDPPTRSSIKRLGLAVAERLV